MNPNRFRKKPGDYREEGKLYRFTLMIAILVVILMVISVELWHMLNEFFRDKSSVMEFIGNLGKWSPIGMIILHAAQVVVAPIPGQVLDLVNGYMYGPLLGSLFSLIGIIIGSVMAMWLARRFGRPLVERFVNLETMNKFDQHTSQRGEMMIFLVFLMPFLPDDAVCFLAGLTNIPLPRLIFLAAAGRLPGIIIASSFGAMTSEFRIVHWVIVGMVAISAGVIYWRFRDGIEHLIMQVLVKLSA